jgi:integrase
VSVYKPRNSRIWQFDFIIRGERYHGSTGVLNRRAAEEVERLKRQEAALGKFGQVADMTLDAACGRFWTEVGQYRGDAADVERRLDGLLSLIGKGTKLRKIGQAEVAAAIERRGGMTFKKGKDRKGKPAKAYALSDSTVNRDVIETLRPVLKRAKTHWTPTGTPHGLPEIDWRELRLREPRALSRVYSADEKRAWLAEAASLGDDMDLALDLILTNGLRYGELFFPLDAPRRDDEGKPVLCIQKGRKRDVLLWAPLREDHFRRIMARVTMAREAKLEHIWTYREGQKLQAYTYHQIEYRLSKAADAAEIGGGRRIHGGRHHAGSVTLRKTGGNLKAVQAMLGHASIASSQRYAHVDISVLREVVDDEVPRNSPEVGLPDHLKSQLG